MIIGTVQQIWRYPVKSMAGESVGCCLVEQLGIPGDRGWAVRDERTSEITNGKRIPLLMQCAAHYREEPKGGAIPHVEITLSDGSRTSSDDPLVNKHLSQALGKEVTLWPLQPANNKSHYRRADPGARIAGQLSRIPGFRSLLPRLTSFGHMNRSLREMFSREPDEPVPDISVLPPEVLEFTSPPGTYFDAFPVHVVTTATLEEMARFNPAALWDVRRFRPNFLIRTNGTVHGLVEASWNGRTLRLGAVELRCEIPTPRCGMTTHAQAEIPKDATILRTIVKDASQNLGVYANVVTTGQVEVDNQVELL